MRSLRPVPNPPAPPPTPPSASMASPRILFTTPVNCRPMFEVLIRVKAAPSASVMPVAASIIVPSGRRSMSAEAVMSRMASAA